MNRAMQCAAVPMATNPISAKGIETTASMGGRRHIAASNAIAAVSQNMLASPNWYGGLRARAWGQSRLPEAGSGSKIGYIGPPPPKPPDGGINGAAGGIAGVRVSTCLANLPRSQPQAARIIASTANQRASRILNQVGGFSSMPDIVALGQSNL